jgi:DNA invertase Pin-like site-specific DNA recombinase
MWECPCWPLVCLGRNPHRQNHRLARPESEGVQLGHRAAIYARVSTSDQSCERQVSALTAFAERGGYDAVGVFKETASGASANRAARNQILDLAQARQIDAILVSELSRWGRSTQDLLDTLNRPAGWKVSVVAISGMTFELDTPHGRMMATMLAGIARFERDLLSERAKSGLAAARARGKKLGRQPGQRPKADKLAPKVLQAIEDGRSYRWIARDLRISKNTVTDIVRRNRDRA